MIPGKVDEPGKRHQISYTLPGDSGSVNICLERKEIVGLNFAGGLTVDGIISDVSFFTPTKRLSAALRLLTGKDLLTGIEGVTPIFQLTHVNTCISCR